MIKFNSNKKEKLTLKEALEPAMGITDYNEAQQYLKDYAAFLKTWLEKKNEPENATRALEIAKSNIGY